MNKKISCSVLIIFCVLVALFGKVIRHTVMENVLVNNGIGWSFIKYINNNDSKFAFTLNDSNAEDTASAEDNSIFIFDKINFLGLSTYYQFEIYISIIFNILIFILLYKHKKSYTLGESFIILMSVVALNIFSFCLAKEPIQMIYFFLIYAILFSKNSEKNKFVKCILIFILSTITFRNYYIIMIFYMILIYFLIKMLLSRIKKIKFVHMLFIIFTIFASFVFLLITINVINPSAFDELLRVRLRTSDAKTDIHAILVSKNIFLFSLNYILTIIRMLIPAELLLLGPKYYVFIFYQIIVSGVVLKNIKNIRYIDYTHKIALIVFLSFILGSATFEPDFGSWIRHETVLFPVLLYLIQPISNNDEVNLKC